MLLWLVIFAVSITAGYDPLTRPLYSSNFPPSDRPLTGDDGFGWDPDHLGPNWNTQNNLDAREYHADNNGEIPIRLAAFRKVGDDSDTSEETPCGLSLSHLDRLERFMVLDTESWEELSIRLLQWLQVFLIPTLWALSRPYS